MILMAASNRHRKLIESSTNGTGHYMYCPIQCDPLMNPSSVCSPDCIVFCPSSCRPADSSPTPSPATSPYTLPPPTDHHHQPLSLPLKISLIFLVATFVYTVYKFYTVWCRSRPRRTPPENQETRDHNEDVVDHPIWYIRTTGLQPSVINALTVVRFSKINNGGGVVEGTDCSVCLTEFEDDDTLRLLPKCNHAFHMSCIDTWLRSHTNCPLCRAMIVNNTVDSPSSDEQNSNLGFMDGTNLGILSGDRGEASGSSGLRIGGTDEDDVISNSVKTEG
ncbi:hypothetical protein SSX86_031340 [Deinandra increscens subsp. villosa]|uniref:RING-type E3 ubiquitin transferase n=1 Tax=Deinandra increscens subsp. villosa TaxID=3103831 RepID=A0AAP0C4F6_9ASTR